MPMAIAAPTLPAETSSRMEMAGWRYPSQTNPTGEELAPEMFEDHARSLEDQLWGYSTLHKRIMTVVDDCGRLGARTESLVLTTRLPLTDCVPSAFSLSVP